MRRELKTNDLARKTYRADAVSQRGDTGNRQEHQACQIVGVEGGKPKSMRHDFDMMTMMQKLGLAG
ncbi:MAG: hypothetical protein ACRENG_26340 [bacterium]